jgi:uncharacterized membrane protein YeaQ/YmgE (transglycosylase-associated protein family)
MNTTIWLMAGGLLGWGGYSGLRMNESIGRMAAVIVGAISGIVGGKQVAPLFGGGAELIPGAFSPSALFFAVATAVAILVAMHMVLARWWR